MKISFLTATALAALTLAAACKKKDDNPAPATQQLSGTLSGANSIKPTSASTATGTVTGTYDPNTQMLNYTLTFSGLTGPPKAAHFHYGDPQHTGDIFIPLSNLPTGTSGTITGSTMLTTVPAVPAVPATATTPAVLAKPMAVQSDSFKLGHVYANIHTAMYPAGEIRANVVVK
ncbi:hypothetical protein A0257_07325 [Hymenobacter psoromatis]|nr:hypothetical protein A0257_07325 [Hymenobacter psoromatis]